MSRVMNALVPAVALLSLAACSGTPGTQTSVQPVPEVSQGGSTESAAPTGGDDQKAAQTYFGAIVSADPDEETDALSQAAPKSLALAYLQHRVNIDNAETDAGTISDAEDLTEDNGTYGYCPGGDTESDDCVKWENVRFNGGKVVDFTVDGKSLENRLTLGSGDAVKAGGLAQVTFLSAYQSVQSNSMFVTFKVKTGDKKVTIASYEATYRSPDGRQSSASNNGGPSDIDKNSTATVYSVFKRAKPGGTIKIQVFDAKTYEGPTLKIKTR